MGKWRCTVCGYIYNEEKGESVTGTPAGTRFEDLPKQWRCPICGASKEAFVKEAETDIHAEAETTVAEVIISELEKWGVSFVLGLPGTSSLGIIEAIRKTPSIRFIVVRHEANAAFAASAYNKLTGKIAACVTIAGPGATNLATGLYDAKEDGASVLSLNGQVEVQYTGPGGFQEIDQDAFFRPVTVFNNTIYDKSMTVRLLTMALKSAVLDHGVAQLSVPNDVQKEPLNPRYCTRENCIFLTNYNIIPDEKEMAKAVTLIDQSRKPVIIAGWGAHETALDLNNLAKKIKAPIVTTYRAKGILPESSEWVMGLLGTTGSAQARSLVSESDLLITLGVGFSKMTGVPADKPMIQVDLDPKKLGRVPFTVALWGNCNLVVPRLLGSVKEKDDPLVLPHLAALKKEWDDQREKEADPNAVPIRPPYIIRMLEETIPEDAVISVDIGENMWWFGRNFRIKRQKIVISGYLGTMGTGLPGAIAAKVAYPEKTVVCITGDGGFSQSMADFVTTVKNDLPMVVVVMNNHQLAMIQVEQKMENYPNFGTDLLNPDFAEYAEICGGTGIKVDKPEDLKPALIKALEMNRPVIVDIDTDPKRF